MTATKYIIVAIILGLLPAVLAKKRGEDFFIWWVYGVCLFPFALIHAALLYAFLKPGSASVEPLVRGGPPSEADQQDDSRARMQTRFAAMSEEERRALAKKAAARARLKKLS